MIDQFNYIVQHPQADLVLAALLAVVVLFLSISVYRNSRPHKLDVSIKFDQDKEEEE